ncbi:hypothetical protein Tco_1351093 [Tanacetum coccineum]
MNNNLSRPVTQHYLPKRRESVFAKPDHMIASSESRDSSKNMPRFSSNDMVHNHYLDEARKKTQERDMNLKTSVMPYARFQSTADGRKPKPRSTNHSTRSLLVSKSSCVTITAVPKADHSKNSSSFSDSKHFVCSTYLSGHTFSPYKTSAAYEKTSPRSDLRWKPTGRIFKTVGLRWVPTGKILASCTSKEDSEPTHGSNVDILTIYERKQTLDLSAVFRCNHAADNPDKRQQQNTTHTSTTTDVADPPPLNIHSTHQTPTQVPTVSAPENIIQAETNTENAQFDDDEFINIFSNNTGTRTRETSSLHVDSSNMQPILSTPTFSTRVTKDHPI